MIAYFLFMSFRVQLLLTYLACCNDFLQNNRKCAHFQTGSCLNVCFSLLLQSWTMASVVICHSYLQQRTYTVFVFLSRSRRKYIPKRATTSSNDANKIPRFLTRGCHRIPTNRKAYMNSQLGQISLSLTDCVTFSFILMLISYIAYHNYISVWANKSLTGWHFSSVISWHRQI